MFSGGRPFGFYNAPVSKALLVITGAASTLNILFPVFKFKALIKSGTLSYFEDSKIFSGILRAIAYSNGKNLFFGSLLMYSFRIFEHRYGSKKFTDYIFASILIGAGLQYVIMLTQHMTIEEFPTGPFWVIFSFYVPFLLSIPSVNSSNLFGFVPYSGKLFTYIFGIQMLLTSKGTVLSGLSGIVAGLVCHFNVFYVKQWLTVPHAVNSLFSRIFGNLFDSAAPNNAEKPRGATLEIQRQIRMDELDQQMWNLQQMNVRRRWPLIGNPMPGNSGGSPRDRNIPAEPVQQPTTEASEEQIQRLIEMGFTRYAVLQALTASNNNMTTAMNILLSE